MSTAVAAKTEGQVARPLHVLVPLIKKDLDQGREASDRASLPYYQAAGEKMLEAKSQLKHGEFQDWIKRNFEISIRHAQSYMAAADAEKRSGLRFSSLSEAIRETSNPNYNKPHTVRPQAWHEPVKGVISRAKDEADRLRDENLNRAQEREAQRKLALQLIDIGYKILSKELHPDKGGSRDAMVRLNQVRDRLKMHA